MNNKTINVVMVEPNKPAYVAKIGSDLKSLQAAVGGLIEPIGNEEAWVLGMKPNRRFSEGIIAGTFFICGDKDGEFCSLSDDKCNEYLRAFSDPNQLYNKEFNYGTSI